MTTDAWLTLAVLLVVLVVLVLEPLPAPLAVLGGVTALLLTDVIDAEQALSGFSNPAPIAVATLYVLAAAAERTGVVAGGVLRLLRTGLGQRSALARMLIPSASVSAFLNNTPIVAMAAPAAATWARQSGRSPSPYLLPLVYAVSLGGIVTLVGTSTNLVVSGLLEETGRRQLGLFEQAPVGLPIAVVGVALLVLLSKRLLPRRRASSENLGGDAREFTVEMIVTAKLVGTSVAEARLRNLEGVFLVELERGGRRITPVGPDEVLAENDRLIFAGNVGRVLDLQQRPGIRSAEQPHFSVTGSDPDRRLYEVVVAESSPLVGSTLKEAGFRGRYGGAVIAIHRAAGERVAGRLGGVSLRPGDVLAVLADREFAHRWHGARDFFAVAPLQGEPPPRTEKAWIVALILAGLLATVGTGTLEILEAGLLAAFAVLALRVLSPAQARDAIDLNVVLLIAASFGLAAAMTGSGLAAELADGFVQPLAHLGDTGILAGVLVVTIVLTQLIANNAAAALMFPIAIAAAEQASLDARPFAIAVAIGASAAFLTPIGYQTNMMVYGMGGYRFGDYARLGLPLTVVVLALSLVLIPIWWPLR